MEAYRDLRTLKARCQQLLSVILRRRLREKDQAKALLKKRRQKVLTSILGGESRYQEVLCLVQKVQSLRVGALLVSSCNISHNTNGSDATEKSSGQLSQPARDLFNNVRLVQVFQTTPSNQLADLNCWDEMIEECQSILESYRRGGSKSL